MLLFSVIVTTYNSKSFILKTIDSILNQEGINDLFCVELIVVDDCSIDGTYDFLLKKGINVFSTEKNSGGPNKGRNIGLSKATGDYICINDHDDIWVLDRLKQTLPYLNLAPIISCGYQLRKKGKSTSFRVKKDKQYKYYQKNETFINILERNYIQSQNVYLSGLMFAKKLAKTYFEEGYGVVDYDWLLRLFEDNDSIELCKPLFIRIVTDSNLSLDENYRLIDFNFNTDFVKCYKVKYPKSYKKSLDRAHSSRAKYYFVMGDKKKVRYYLKKSNISLKNTMYYLATFVGYNFLKKRLNIFG